MLQLPCPDINVQPEPGLNFVSSDQFPCIAPDIDCRMVRLLTLASKCGARKSGAKMPPGSVRTRVLTSSGKRAAT